MAQITMIMGLIALFVVSFVAWSTLWHRRFESAFQRVPVRRRRSVHPQHRDLPSDAPHR